MVPRSALYSLMLSLALLPRPLSGGEPARLDRYGDSLPPRAIARMGTARLRVDERIVAFAFWPDDRTLAACCRDGSVRFWDRATGREIRRLQTPLSSVRSAVFVPGKKTVALLGEERDFHLWDTASAKTVWRDSLPKYDQWRVCIAASPDGKLLAVPATYEEVRLYETASGRKLRSLEEAGSDTLAFSPDSTLLAIASRKFLVYLWDIRSGKKIRYLPSSQFNNHTLAFAQDGKWIAVGGDFTDVFVSDAAAGKTICRLEIRDELSRGGLLFTADGKSVITGHYPGFVRFWDAATGKERFSRQIAPQFESWPVLSGDGKVLAVANQRESDHRFIHLLDPATGKKVGPPADGHDSQLNFVAFCRDGKTLLCGDRETIREWKSETGEPGRQVSRPLRSDDVSAFSTDRKLLAYSSASWVDIREIRRDKLIRSLEYKGKDAIRAVAFSPDGKYLVSAHNHSSPQSGQGKIEGQDGLHFWDLATGKEIRSSATPTTDLYSQLVITPDGRTAIAGSVTGTVTRERTFTQTETSFEGAGQLYLWDLPSGRQVRTLHGHRGAIRLLALSGDGRLLVSGSADHTVRLWELASGQTLFELSLAKTFDPVAALSPDGRLLATASGPEGSRPFTIFLWSAATGKPVLELNGHNSTARCLAFSPDNRRLASGFRDGTALVWDVSDACRTVRPDVRQLKPKELEALWTNLADTDASKAHRATEALIAGGSAAVGMLKDRLRPAVDVEPGRLRKLLAELDADQFAVREAAMQALQRLGERAEPALSAALKKRPSLEARKRIEELLKRSLRRDWTSDQLRELRALRVLEQIGGEKAIKILQALAKGCADAWLTQQAKASLLRLRLQANEPEA